MKENLRSNMLADVNLEHSFITKNGNVIKNLKELHDSVKNMEDDEFNHHVNNERNDFHNWVRDVHKDDKLAKNLLRSKTNKDAARHIKNRINEHSKNEPKKKEKTKNKETISEVNEIIKNELEEDIVLEMPEEIKPCKTDRINVDFMKGRILEFTLAFFLGAVSVLILKSMI